MGSLLLLVSSLQGRGGRGNIFVFAAGNGGAQDDDCNCDGYVASIYTIAITALSGNGTKPWYTEPCTAITAATYSGAGTETDQNITTTDGNSGCTDQHSGTSAAAPLAAGMIALALQVKPDLTWRDVQHLIVRTSSVVDPGRSDWRLNGAGLHVSRSYGFGAMDTERLVNTARNWTGVGQQHECTTQYTGLLPQSVGHGLSLSIQSTGCRGSENEVRYLEHVVANVTLKSRNRGSISVYLWSPKLTSSKLLQQRKNDDSSNDGYNNWSFMTVHNWGEDPEGTWDLTIGSESFWSAYMYEYYYATTIESWTLTLYGTQEPPLLKYPCHTECNGCSGPGSNECLSCLNFSEQRGGSTHCVPSCSSEKIPLYTLNGRDIRCVSECDNGTYRDGNRCLPCDWACQTCFKSLSDSPVCLKCRSRYFKHFDTCVTSCPDGYYGDRETNKDGGDNYQCVTCHSSCSTCRGPDITDCTSCRHGQILLSNSCFQPCADDQYRFYKDGGDNQCVTCHSSCSTCRGPDISDCTSCRPGQILLSNSCFQPCADDQYRFYNVTLGSWCEDCHSSCQTCSGPDEYQCLSCNSGYFFSVGVCVRRSVSCPDGTYVEWLNECRDCDDGCRECDKFECSSCFDGYQLTFLNSENECIRDDGNIGSGGGSDGGGERKPNTLVILFGALGSVVVVIGTAVTVCRCSRMNSHSQAQRSWRSLVTVSSGDSGGNAQTRTSVGEADTRQLLEENPSASPTDV